MFRGFNIVNIKDLSRRNLHNLRPTKKLNKYFIKEKPLKKPRFTNGLKRSI